MVPARSVGSAGLGRSYASAGNALVLNPAALGVAKQYVLGTTYSLARARTAAEETEFHHLLGVEWTDSTPNALNLAMGLSYALDLGAEEKRHNAHGALVYVLDTAMASINIGVGGHFAQDFGTGLTPEDLWSFDAGLALNFRNQFMLGLVGYNLVDSLEGELPIGVGGGASYWFGSFVFAFDLSAMVDAQTRAGNPADSLLTYILGLQYMLSPDFFVRLSGRHDAGEEDLSGNPSEWSLGAGLTFIAAERVGLELGYHQQVDRPDDFRLAFTIELYNPFGM